MKRSHFSTLPKSFFSNPSLEFLLPVHIHIDHVVIVGSYASIDDCRNEESDSRCCVAVNFHVESFRPYCHDKAEVKLNVNVLTRKKVEKAERKRQYI